MLLLAALVLLVAACSDDDDTRKPTPTITQAAAPTPTATDAGPMPSPTRTLAPGTPTHTPPPGTPTTPAATRTITATRTPAGTAELEVGSVQGMPGETVSISVTLVGGSDVAGVQNDIGFAPEAPIAARQNGRPDCTVNPEINKDATSFAFQPSSCTPGVDCSGMRAIVLALDNVDRIEDGVVLYTCQVAIPIGTAIGIYALPCSNADASDPNGVALDTSCTAGGIIVRFPQFPTATPTDVAATPTTAAPTPTPTEALPTSTPTEAGTWTPTPLTGADGPVLPLASHGRWFTDALGRVVLMHGVNMVSKRSPFYPAFFGFGDDDAAFLEAHGFNAVRLGVDFRGLMPTPGVVETEYIEHLAETVDTLVAHDLFVLIDFHQDGFAPKYNGNGLPDWMAIDDGLPNPPDAVFPLYYLQNPAMQRAFESFWANREGPNGVGLQEYYVQGVRAVAERFAGEPRVLGTELINEPWPGADWSLCGIDVNGCPGIEAERLKPFYDRGATAARAVAPDKLVFVEPFVLFNFGNTRTTIPGADERLALSFHAYALDMAGEQGVVANAVAAATRDERPIMCTEFGATQDPVILNRLTAQFDANLLPWLFWAYNENIVRDMALPPEGNNLRSQATLDALERPYPIAVAGIPTALSFDPATKAFHFEYAASGALPQHVLTVISMPTRYYPGGKMVRVQGGQVTSEAGASLLTVRALDAHVIVDVTQ